MYNSRVWNRRRPGKFDKQDCKDFQPHSCGERITKWHLWPRQQSIFSKKKLQPAAAAAAEVAAARRTDMQQQQ